MNAVATLYAEELKATMRGRFAWLGAAVILLAIGGLATVGTQDTWLDGYGIVAYGLVPLGFLPLAAGFIASPRTTRFVESVFTAPVERHHWLVAKVLVLLTLAAGYYIALLPMLLVYLHLVGFPFLLGRFLLWTPGIMIVSIAIGTLAGVLFIGRSVAAPTATAMGLLLAYVGLVPLQELLVARGDGATRTGHIVLASPAVLLKNALGFTLAVGSIPSTAAMTWLSLAIVTAGSMVLAAWVFLKAQGVETWETTRGKRWTIGVSLAGLVLLPILLADTGYDKAAPPANLAPALGGIFGRASGNLAMVPPGGPLPKRCCSPILNRQADPLGTDEGTREDMLLLLPVDAGKSVTDLKVQIAGQDGLDTSAGEPRLESHTYNADSGPIAADGHHVLNGWVARVPVTLAPTKPWDIGGNRYPVEVSAVYTVAPPAQTLRFNARGAVEAQVSIAIYEMGAASSILPLLCFAAAFMRFRRTR